MICIIHFNNHGRNAEIASHIAKGVQTENISCSMMTIEAIDHQLLDACDAIIFGCPTYFGSIPGAFKSFLDSTSYIWQQGKWRNKIAAGFTDSSALSGDKLSTLIQLNIFCMQHGMIWVGLDLPTAREEVCNRIGAWIGLMVQSTIDKSSIEAKHDNVTAQYFGKRVAQIVKKIVN